MLAAWAPGTLKLGSNMPTLGRALSRGCISLRKTSFRRNSSNRGPLLPRGSSGTINMSPTKVYWSNLFVIISLQETDSVTNSLKLSFVTIMPPVLSAKCSRNLSS